MHAPSASQISGRTRTAVSAMCVRTLRMTVLESAGNSPAANYDLSAEKFQCVKCFVFASCGICWASNFRTPARPAGFENVWLWPVDGRGSLLRQVRSALDRRVLRRSPCGSAGADSEVATTRLRFKLVERTILRRGPWSNAQSARTKGQTQQFLR